jgi:membrane protein DedA with SNARE-associated domain
VLETLVEYVNAGVEIARVWGPLIIFVLMTIESSFIPFPSEIIMIPAGVMIARGEFVASGTVGLALAIAIGAGLAGSLAGAFINYYLSLWLGRPFLHRYGRYMFLKPQYLDRAEAIFREYGEITTFVCRLIPAIRQLISIPAGISRMNIGRFALFTTLGAGIWVTVLTCIGYGLGAASVGKTYRELVFEGKDLIHHNLVWVLLGLAALVGVYVFIHRRVMHGRRAADTAPPR